MSQKLAKKLRKRLRDERNESERVSDACDGPLNPTILQQKKHSAGLPNRLLMRRKDPNPNEFGPKMYRGGAILHPLSERAQYQFAKKKGLGV